MKKRLVIALAAATLLAGCGQTDQTASSGANNSTINQIAQENESSSDSLTIEILDSEGNTQTQIFNSIPTRVITNNQSSLELLLELGLEDSIIGTIALDNPVPEHLQEAFSKVDIITESKTDPAKEVIAGMNPDLVIGRAATFTDERYGSVTGLNGMNINVYTQLASQMKIEQSIDNIFKDITNVGAIFGVEEKANELMNNLQERLNTVKEKTKSINQEPLKVMVMTAYKEGTYTVFGANSTLQNEMLEVIGCENINEKGGQQSLENLLELNPDVIVYVYNNKNAETDSAAAQNLLGNEMLQGVTAIQNNKVIEASYTEFMGYGYRSIECIENLAAALYPELF